MIRKEHRCFLQNETAIPGDFQHVLLLADIDKNKIRKVVRKINVKRKKISLLKDEKIRKQFETKVIELADIGNS